MWDDMFQVGEWMDRHEEAKTRFLQFGEKLYASSHFTTSLCTGQFQTDFPTKMCMHILSLQTPSYMPKPFKIPLFLKYQWPAS
jgi:hypothetical protein